MKKKKTDMELGLKDDTIGKRYGVEIFRIMTQQVYISMQWIHKDTRLYTYTYTKY